MSRVDISGGEDGQPSGEVVTFYSFKGGTGRSMALANVAWILAANGMRVLVADWDLESPGLHRFFHPFLDPDDLPNRPGIIDLLREYENEARKHRGPRPADWLRQFVPIQQYAFSLNWDFPAGGTLDLLPAGRQNRDYSGPLDWNVLFDRLAAADLLKSLREAMKARYDFTLIDSRTGLTDVADVCTLHLPDTLVTCFTLSDQGIEGTAQRARDVQAHQNLHPIRVLPVPMRVDQAEKEKLAAGRASARLAFGNLPAEFDVAGRNQYWDAVEVPYEAFYAYEETLTTFVDPPGSRRSLLAAYLRLADVITHGSVTALPELDAAEKRRVREQFRRKAAPVVSEITLQCTGPEQPWAEWVEDVLAAVHVRVVDLRPVEQRTTHTVDPDEGRQVLTIRSTRLGVQIAPGRPAQSRSSEVVFVPHGEDASSAAAADGLLRLVGRADSAEAEVAGRRVLLPRREPRWRQLPPRNPDFTGRDEIIWQLRRQFREHGGVVSLIGLGGVGKTELAKEYAHRFRHGYDLIWWIDTDHPGSVEGSLDDLAAVLGLPRQTERALTVASLLASLRQGRPARDWLLVLDNVESIPVNVESAANWNEATPQAWSSGPVDTGLPAEVSALLAQQVEGTPGHILVTSRAKDVQPYGKGVGVRPFLRAESTTALRRRVGKLTEPQAERVAALVDDLPLALFAAVGAWEGSEGDVDVDAYLSGLEESLPSKGGGLYQALHATFRDALERLEQQSLGASRMLQVFSVLGPRIPLDFIFSRAMSEILAEVDPRVSDRNMLQPLLQHLDRFSLVSIDQENELVQVHRQLQDYVRGQMTPDELTETRRSAHRLLAGARPGPDVDDPRLWPTFRLIWPHLVASRAIHSGDPEVRRLILNRVRYMWLRGDWENGERLARDVQARWERLLADPAEHPDGTALPSDNPDRPDLERHLLRLRHNLANILRDRGRFTEAHDLDEQTFSRLRETLGDDHMQTLLSAGSLGADLRHLGRFTEALELARNTEAISRKHFGDRYPISLTAANNLAKSLRATGDYREALAVDESLYPRLVAAFGRDQPRTLRGGNGLGRDLREVGNYAESVRILKSLLDICQKSPELDDKTTLGTQVNLAASMRSSGDLARAGALLEDAYERLRTRLGDGHVETLACRLSRATNLLVSGEIDLARREARAATQACEQSLGRHHVFTLIARNNLAATLRANRRPSDVLDLAAAVAQDFDRLLGPGHPYTLAAQMNIAVLLDDTGSAQAAPTMSRATAALGHALGDEHPDYLIGRVLTGFFEWGPDDRVKAPAAQQALRELGKRIGDEHPLVLKLGRGKLVVQLIDPGDAF